MPAHSADLPAIVAGENDTLVTFLEVERFGTKLAIPGASENFQNRCNSQKQAAETALCAGKLPSISVIFPRISPATIGQFIYLYQSAVSYFGGLCEIQPPIGPPT